MKKLLSINRKAGLADYGLRRKVGVGQRLPKRDHSTTWFDPETKKYLLVDEPYEASIRNEFDKRQYWAERFEFSIRRPDWAGMYYPDGGSVMELVSHNTKGVPLEPIVNALNKFHNPVARENSDWIELPITPFFSSPEERKKQNQATSKPAPKKNRAKSISYNTVFSSGYIRPPEKMAIAAHKEIGTHLKSAYSISYMRQGARNAINSVRSTLDDWVQIEYDRKSLPDSEFFNMYYHGPSSLFRKPNLEENDVALSDLQKVQTIIKKYYPDCAAREQILNKLGKAYKSLSSWKLS